MRGRGSGAPSRGHVRALRAIRRCAATPRIADPNPNPNPNPNPVLTPPLTLALTLTVTLTPALNPHPNPHPDPDPNPGCAERIPRIDARTIDADAFEQRFMRGSVDDPPRPVILTHALAEWPARRCWDFEYLRAKAGCRLVPVETYAAHDATQTYLSDSWTQRVMSLADYLDRYMPHVHMHAMPHAHAHAHATRAHMYLVTREHIQRLPAPPRSCSPNPT